MVRITLIQTSQGRNKELKRFVESLNSQLSIDFSQVQLIFLDQADSREIFKILNKNIIFDYVQIERTSLSHARNIGLEMVKGDYIGFPDDDCWYTPYTLSQVLAHFRKGANGVCAQGLDERDFPTTKAPRTGVHQLTPYNQLGAISYTIFLRFSPILKFNEKLGVGSPCNLCSGEETDYVYHSMRNNSGLNYIYDSNIIVHHPLAEKGYYRNELDKVYNYSRGYGYILMLDKYPFKKVFVALCRPLVGIFLFLVTKKLAKSRRSYYILKGRLEGLLYFYFH